MESFNEQWHVLEGEEAREGSTLRKRFQGQKAEFEEEETEMSRRRRRSDDGQPVTVERRRAEVAKAHQARRWRTPRRRRHPSGRRANSWRVRALRECNRKARTSISSRYVVRGNARPHARNHGGEGGRANSPANWAAQNGCFNLRHRWAIGRAHRVAILESSAKHDARMFECSVAWCEARALLKVTWTFESL